jgi:hypothetical protein
MGALVIHGIATLATQPSEPASPPQEPPIHPVPDPYSSKPSITFAPTLVGDGAVLAPGLGAVGRF